MGPFDNKDRKFLQLPGFEDGHWFQDAAGNLIIVPKGTAEIQGADGPLLDELNKTYRETPFRQIDPRVVASRLQLEYVEQPLRRFDPTSGYYSA